MSVNNYQFTCSVCGHVENKSEGIYIFSDKCFTMLQCPQCKKVSSILLSEIATKAKDYPLCPDCNIKMIGWDKSCPECGSKMDNSSRYSDTI